MSPFKKDAGTPYIYRVTRRDRQCIRLLVKLLCTDSLGNSHEKTYLEVRGLLSQHVGKPTIGGYKQQREAEE